MESGRNPRRVVALATGWVALVVGLALTQFPSGARADDVAPAGTAGAEDPVAAPAPAPTPAPEAPGDRASKRPATPPGPMPLPAGLPDPATLVVIELHGEVDLGMAAFVERVAASIGPGEILVLDINTFGGRVDAAVGMRDALLHVRDRGGWAVAYVHPRAISAGALISLSTDVIVVAPGATIGAATPVTIEGGKMEPVEEKVVSYMRQEMRSTAEAKGRSGDIAEAMVDADREIDGLDDRGKLLTLDGKLALAWGVASVEARDLDALAGALGYGPGGKSYQVRQVRSSWAEDLAGWLSSSAISGLLMTVGMLGLMIGLYTGGSPIPIGVGVVCLGVFFFGHNLVHLAGIEDIILFLIGLALIIYEVTIPGHIVPGIVGAVCVLAALVLGLVNVERVPLSVQWAEGWIVRALATVCGSLLATAVIAIAAFRILPESRIGRRLSLRAVVEGTATDATAAANQELVGLIGSAASDLRPAGKVKVGDRRVDAVAERGFIVAGTAVKIVRAEGYHVVVAAIEENKA